MISYKFKLYKSKKTKHLDATMHEACGVWNHALALQRRYYRLFGKFIPKFTLAKHMTKVWQRHCLGSQSMQEVTERLNKSYSRFFKHNSKRPPKFKKNKRLHVFCFQTMRLQVRRESCNLNSRRCKAHVQVLQVKGDCRQH